MKGSPSTALLLVSARAQFPDAWHQFLHPDASQTDAVLTLPLSEDQLPFLPGAGAMTIKHVDVLSKWRSTVGATSSLRLVITPPGEVEPVTSTEMVTASALGGLGHVTLPADVNETLAIPPGVWSFKLRTSELPPALVNKPPSGPHRLKPDVLEDIWLLLSIKRGV